MASNRILVRAKPGRKAFTAPSGGKQIPEGGEGIPVPRTGWIMRLLDVHGDIEEVVPAKPAIEKPSDGKASK
jgi:hypothetical protein